MEKENSKTGMVIFLKILSGFSISTILFIFGGLILVLVLIGGLISITTSAAAVAAGGTDYSTNTDYANPYLTSTDDYDSVLAAAAERYEIPAYFPPLKAILVAASGETMPDVMATHWFNDMVAPADFTADESIDSGVRRFRQLLVAHNLPLNDFSISQSQLDSLIPVLEGYRNGSDEENHAFAMLVREYLSGSVTSLSYPIENHYISSGYGSRNLNVSGVAMSFHHGTDFPASTGTPIFASMTGTVVFAGYLNSTYGYVVQIRWSGNVNVISLYAHCSAVAVSLNQTVQTGDTIAYVGMSGMATGPHCHLGLYLYDADVDPMPYITGEKVLPLGGKENAEAEK